MRLRYLLRVQEGTVSAHRDPWRRPPHARIAVVPDEVEDELELDALDDEYDDDDGEDELAAPREVVETHAAPPKARPAGERRRAAPPSAGPDPLRLGDEGRLAVNVTRRLSYVRRKTTGQPYLDGARERLDAEAVAAVRAFQTDHRLEPDGVVGPKTARELHRAVLLERVRRKKAGEQPEDVTTQALAEVTEVLARMERTLDALETTVAESQGGAPPESA